jgi:hypothetical protein
MAGDGTIVFPRLGPGATTAARLDRPTGVVTPPETSWRRRPVVLNRRPYVYLRGNNVRVDLQVERFNGWRVAAIPLYAVGPWGAAVQPVELLRALKAELAERRPKNTDRIIAALDEQVSILRDDPRRLDIGPFAREITRGIDRVLKPLD